MIESHYLENEQISNANEPTEIKYYSLMLQPYLVK